MALSIQDSRILLKRSTYAAEEPTIPTSNDFTDGTWLDTDVYIGETFANTIDEKMWFRFTDSIRQIAIADNPTADRLTFWNAEGHLANVAAPTNDYFLKYTSLLGYHWAAASAGDILFSQADLVALVTTIDGSQATLTTISNQPIAGTTIQLFVNGQQISVGDGVKTKGAYISGDSGTTARTFSTITIGDTIHWNGSVNNYQLDAQDELTLMYLT